MAWWGEFAEAAPTLAERLEREFMSTGLVMVGTLRRDGRPRISPVEPWIGDGHLYLNMMWRSQKALDLLRDPRCEVHSALVDRLGPQLKVWGGVSEASDEELHHFAEVVKEQLGWAPYPQSHLFRVDVLGASFISYSEDCPDGWLRIRTWSPARGSEERGPLPPPGSGED